MLLGLLAGRARIVDRVSRSPALSRRALLVALPLAIVTRLAYDVLLSLWTTQSPMPAIHNFTINALYQASSWALAATYLAALLLALQSGSWVRRLWPLRAVGRMAFTNYLMQGLLIVPICLLFGWFDKVTPSRGFLLALAVALLQLLFSSWWLRRHAAGPFEGLWRRVTYGA